MSSAESTVILTGQRLSGGKEKSQAYSAAEIAGIKQAFEEFHSTFRNQD